MSLLTRAHHRRWSRCSRGKLSASPRRCKSSATRYRPTRHHHRANPPRAPSRDAAALRRCGWRAQVCSQRIGRCASSCSSGRQVCAPPRLDRSSTSSQPVYRWHTQPVPRGVGSPRRVPRSEGYPPNAYTVHAGTGKTQLCKALAEFLFDSPEVAYSCDTRAHTHERGAACRTHAHMHDTCAER